MLPAPTPLVAAVAEVAVQGDEMVPAKTATTKAAKTTARLLPSSARQRSLVDARLFTYPNEFDVPQVHLSSPLPVLEVICPLCQYSLVYS